MIGLSLSFCIKDVIEGRMPVEAIDSLITGTMAETAEEWCELLDRYCAVYWRKDPVRARRIVTALRALGKIDQPRCRGAVPPPIGTIGHWIDGPTETIAKRLDATRLNRWLDDPLNGR